MLQFDQNPKTELKAKTPYMPQNISNSESFMELNIRRNG